mgnify:CR=1 FL=1
MSLNGWPSAPVPHPSLVFKTDGNALGVGVQALMLGKIGNAGLNFAQGIAGVIKLDFFTKSSTPSGLEKRAVPLVGRVWLGPAK